MIAYFAMSVDQVSKIDYLFQFCCEKKNLCNVPNLLVYRWDYYEWMYKSEEPGMRLQSWALPELCVSNLEAMWKLYEMQKL